MFMCTWVRSEQAVGGETISEQEHLMAQRVCMYDRCVCFLNRSSDQVFLSSSPCPSPGLCSRVNFLVEFSSPPLLILISGPLELTEGWEL